MHSVQKTIMNHWDRITSSPEQVVVRFYTVYEDTIEFMKLTNWKSYTATQLETNPSEWTFIVVSLIILMCLLYRFDLDGIVQKGIIHIHCFTKCKLYCFIKNKNKKHVFKSNLFQVSVLINKHEQNQLFLYYLFSEIPSLK